MLPQLNFPISSNEETVQGANLDSLQYLKNWNSFISVNDTSTKFPKWHIYTNYKCISTH